MTKERFHIEGSNTPSSHFVFHLDSKICLVTGASSGIGRATAARLAATGDRVVMVSRDRSRGELARKEIASESQNNSVELMIAELSSPASIRSFAAQFEATHPKLDVLINDAAIFNSSRVVTPDGFEMMFATNYLGPFLLTRLLIPRLEAAKPSRIINVTAPSTTRPNLDDLQGERKFGALNAFGASKAADLLFTYALARRLEGRGVTANAYHPGIVRTSLMRAAPVPVRLITGIMNLLVGVTPQRAAEGVAQFATSGQFTDITGKLVHGSKTISAPFIDDRELQENLWNATSTLLGLSRTV